MTKEQKDELKRLISTLIRASEELGEVPSSMYWNAAYIKQQQAEHMVYTFINQINESK